MPSRSRTADDEPPAPPPGDDVGVWMATVTVGQEKFAGEIKTMAAKTDGRLTALEKSADQLRTEVKSEISRMADPMRRIAEAEEGRLELLKRSGERVDKLISQPWFQQLMSGLVVFALQILTVFGGMMYFLSHGQVGTPPPSTPSEPTHITAPGATP